MKSYKNFIEENINEPKFGDSQSLRAVKNARKIIDKMKQEYKDGKIDLPTLQHSTKHITHAINFADQFKDDPQWNDLMRNHIDGTKYVIDRTLERGSKSLNVDMAKHAKKHLTDLLYSIEDYFVDNQSHQYR